MAPIPAKWMTAGSAALVVRYSPTHIIPPVAQRYLTSPVHPIGPKIAYMYANRDRKTLWWRVSVSPLHQFKRVVRSWCARRVRIAFESALNKRGIDKLGHPLPSDAPRRKQSLIGSLEVIARPPCVQQSFTDLQKDADRLLGDILRLRALNRGRSPIKSKLESKSHTQKPS
ncbi:hypothetical protein N7495_007518 [Penicillium taxi]|uniref:uncharacterized protein n=1 Tax=Penicillium taxi TaxID=168475 RepID=UPI0025451328|nr:uncharacterized protein N7495_007518 [Penicillium taxi]KAJ5887477.1 hypothetical protein N7495_007518 [Penicillium taxi]